MAWQYAALAGYQMISSFQQAEMIKMQSDIQKEIDQFNAQLAEYDAWRVVGYGQTQMARYQSQVDQQEAMGRVSAAAAGQDIASGSLSEIAQENRVIAAANLLDIEARAREQALGYNRQARDIRMNSQLNQLAARTQQQSVITGGLFRAGGTLAAGALKNSTSSKPRAESGYTISNPGSESLRMPDSILTAEEDTIQLGYLTP